ncbi:MAG TPA: cytochrome c [Ramlibacter sp.]|uniref:c-type cytochrome n=1 Tax=Ramlibacter sp. TaxID=1917967 RepID=UPI002C80102B|nr:cytochrome c [Ramlibacter sp.]HVZ43167.1 cytochrome c [Ramlibacter sp.]
MRLLFIAVGMAAAVGWAGYVLGQPKSSPAAPPPPPAQAAAAGAEAQISLGRYLVAVGDCIACHTPKGGARFSGGRPLETPFGVVLSANLTPDADTGIGRYTPDTFYRALHEGIDRQGRHLYPAFPYNYYTRVSRADSDAIFAYLRTLAPVRHELERNRLPFPFNIRALMAVWNLMFLDKGPYREDASRPANWNRGAYLVEGLGHCQACHTPKNFLGAPKDGQAFEGGKFAEWFAPDLTPNRRRGIGSWNDDDLRGFLRRGLNAHSAAAAEMGEVVAFSTSQWTDADVDAAVAYLRSIRASSDDEVAAPDPAVMKQGEAIWQDACAACHRMDGSGVPGYFPPLVHDANVQQRDPTTPLHYVLGGARREPTDRAPTPLAMPAFHWKLDDRQVAAVATYVRNSWGNRASPVEPEQVDRLRRKLALSAKTPASGAGPASIDRH